MVKTLFIYATVLCTALAAPFFSRRQAEMCPPSHLIIARGSTEPQGPGILISMANKIMAMNPGTTMESIVYPAELTNYEASVGNGTAAVGQQFGAFVQRCPNSKVALLGFSQVSYSQT